MDHLDDIAAAVDVDMMFIWPADLAQSMGVGFTSAELDAAIERIDRSGPQSWNARRLVRRRSRTDQRVAYTRYQPVRLRLGSVSAASISAPNDGRRQTLRE